MKFITLSAAIFVIFIGCVGAEVLQHKICMCSRMEAPVCASNNITFGNKCEFDCIVGKNNPDIFIVDNGPCSDVLQHKICMCNRIEAPVCASNNITFGSKCEFDCIVGEITQKYILFIMYRGSEA
ncbi:unnamed protein product [Brassicogethes aeneus]|uniref:Kazal-like domain-containing protein n=1 Tax=Brassicogethes aeneus TaxID=1431903 RepID=A0A9P0BJF9_BRAAE|nr:unnamed protein product [Brassicogethes aeneus]